MRSRSWPPRAADPPASALGRRRFFATKALAPERIASAASFPSMVVDTRMKGKAGSCWRTNASAASPLNSGKR
jgi:hypothetical protein